MGELLPLVSGDKNGLMSKSLYKSVVTNRKSIDSRFDFDDKTNLSGLYVFANSQGINNPGTNLGAILIINTHDIFREANAIIQIIFDCYNNTASVRTNWANRWTNWKKINLS